MLKEGDLKLPDHVDVVLSDEGAGYIRGMNDTETMKLATGVYYHTAMYNG